MVTLTITLPASALVLAANDPYAFFALKSIAPSSTSTSADGSQTTATKATSSGNCGSSTTSSFDSATGVLTTSTCGYGTYSVRVVRPANAPVVGGQVRLLPVHMLVFLCRPRMRARARTMMHFLGLALLRLSGERPVALSQHCLHCRLGSGSTGLCRCSGAGCGVCPTSGKIQCVEVQCVEVPPNTQPHRACARHWQS